MENPYSNQTDSCRGELILDDVVDTGFIKQSGQYSLFNKQKAEKVASEICMLSFESKKLG